MASAPACPGSSPTGLVWRRVVLKLSGESLMGDRPAGLDPMTVARLAAEVRDAHALGLELGIVVGGGNIFRGMAAAQGGLDRVAADQMGMLATVINALALQDALEKVGAPTRVLSALDLRQIAEPFIRRRAIRHLEKGRVVILAAGTGNPYFTTDTAAALRAVELNAEALLKATKVDGVYDRDPAVDPRAVLLPEISCSAVLQQRLEVMDSTAISLCRDHRLPIVVFNVRHPGGLARLARGERIGSVVKE